MQLFEIKSKLVYDFAPAAINTIANGKLQTKNETTIENDINMIFFSFGLQADTTSLFPPATLITAMTHCFETVLRTM